MKRKLIALRSIAMASGIRYDTRVLTDCLELLDKLEIKVKEIEEQGVRPCQS